MSKKLRWGILGCARISRRGLIPGIQDSETSTLEIIASRDLTTAQSWASEFGVPQAVGDYAQVVENPNVDAIYIPLPNELHKPWVFAAADAGKHILCEKPLALDSAEAEEMVQYCQDRGVLLMEAFMWRHQHRIQELKRQVDQGLVGDLRFIRSSFSFSIDFNDWRLDAERGGGALWDVGCYGVNTTRLFANAEPETVRASARFGSTGVDMSLTAWLRFPNDILASIDCSFEQPYRCSFELVGSNATIRVPHSYLPTTEPTYEVYSSDSEPPRIVKFQQPNQYSSMVDNFAASVASGQLVAPGEDGLANMRVLDRILNAARDEE